MVCLIFLVISCNLSPEGNCSSHRIVFTGSNTLGASHALSSQKLRYHSGLYHQKLFNSFHVPSHKVYPFSNLLLGWSKGFQRARAELVTVQSSRWEHAATSLPAWHVCARRVPPAAWTTPLLLLEKSKLGLNPHSRDTIPEGIGKTVVKPWIGLSSVHPCYNLLPYVLRSRAGVFLPFCPSFTQITDHVPKLCCREVAWLLSNCVCTERSLGWWAAACRRQPEREGGQDLEEAI